MRTTRHIEISLEHEEIAIRRRGRSIARHCEKCGARAVMLPMEPAAILAGKSVRALYRSLEEGKLHFFESPDGKTLVCAESVKALA